MTKENNKPNQFVIDILIISGYFLLWVICNSTFKNGDLGFWNSICAIISCIVFLCGLRSYKKMGAKTYNIFIFAYFGTLMLNTLNISGYQTAKEARDIYFYMMGGMVCIIWLYLGETISFKLIPTLKIKQLNKSLLLKAIILLYIGLSIYNFIRNGIPLLAGVYSSTALNKFKEAGISGICFILSFILLILSSESNSKKRFIIYSIVLFIEGMLKFSRGNIFRMLLLLFIVFINKKKVRENMRKYKKIIAIFALLIVVGFGLMGNFRTNIRGEKTGGSVSAWINRSIDTNINLGNFGWIYGYTVINFDTMKMVYSQNRTNSISTFIAPFARLVGGIDVMEQYNKQHAFDISRINSSFSINSMKVFITPYIQDLGYLFFIELSLVGIIYMLFIVYSRNGKHPGLYSYILMLLCLSVCGNYLFLSTYVYTIIGSVILFSFTKTDDEDNDDRFFDNVRT